MKGRLSPFWEELANWAPEGTHGSSVEHAQEWVINLCVERDKWGYERVVRIAKELVGLEMTGQLRHLAKAVGGHLQHWATAHAAGYESSEALYQAGMKIQLEPWPDRARVQLRHDIVHILKKVEYEVSKL